MKANIQVNGKTYSDFNELKSLNEGDSFDIYVTLMNNEYEIFDLTNKSVDPYLRFFEVNKKENTFYLFGTKESETHGLLKFGLGENLEGKGYTVYKVFLNITNNTDSEKYNIFLGKLIVTTDEGDLTA